MARRYVVTGATGGLGRALLARLPAARVVAVVRGEAGPPGVAALTRVDVASADWSGVVESGDAVLHLASFVHQRAADAAAVERLREVNVGATTRLAAACRAKGARLVFASSVAVYGRGAEGASEDTPAGPVTEYGRSKLAAEEAIRAEGERGLDHLILRFPLLYGPHGRGNMERMLRAIDRCAYWPVGDPATRKSCLFFDDAAAALVLAADAPAGARGTYVVSARAPCTLRQIHGAAYHALGRREPRFAIPAPPALAVAHGAEQVLRLLGRRPAVVEALTALTAPAWYDGSRFTAATGFDARVPLDEGFARTAAWLRGEERPT
jgi:nucleoside-diphosphate-sugar epimerase